MVLPLDFHHYFEYLLKRDVTKLYIAIAIRNLALGMVLLFEPIYIYLFFGESLPLTILFFAVIYGMYGVLAPFSGMIMGKIGPTKTILISLFLYFSYYLALFFLPQSLWLLPLAIILAVFAMLLFWTAFDTDFARFSSRQSRGGDVGKLNVMKLFPMIVAPVIGGWILVVFGYPVLFMMVLVVLLASTIPLFYSKETHEVYTDSYKEAWKRMWKKENVLPSIGFAANSVETVIAFLFWPLFMFLLATSFDAMGAISSFALVISALFMLYVGKVSDTQERPWLLNVGALWTGISWVIKFFVGTTFDALLAHTLYRISRSAAAVPFGTFFYERAAAKGPETDEFVVNRQIIQGVSRGVFLLLAAAAFWIVPNLPLQAVFFVAAVLSLGFMFSGKLPFSFNRHG
ncbi:MFS transporter [Patescibacteria group bacterium]|nr:MFS transporter [Patescibacteria group bacterium]